MSPTASQAGHRQNGDDRLKENREKADKVQETKKKATVNGELIREIPQAPSSMFFQHNSNLVPPFQVIVDTNFLSHTVSRKIEMLEVMAELEKLGPEYRIALRIARDERWKRLPCDTVHSGTYADDCMSNSALSTVRAKEMTYLKRIGIVDRCVKNRIYIVATNDRDLKRRLRKIPGVPILSVGRGKYVIEMLPDSFST
ncbi:putative rrna-processing protein fcf1 [Diaporthe ampelina]|uniref:Putative rrna-processing protein fcf1 n=1 Tax=Diaporthe ampelina TaxID=1214573 RepID=A0A0G2FST7_9PEZI|nr:putative rrna-processing protein fcf1 [Diaporthe ampelina]